MLYFVGEQVENGVVFRPVVGPPDFSGTLFQINSFPGEKIPRFENNFNSFRSQTKFVLRNSLSRGWENTKSANQLSPRRPFSAVLDGSSCLSAKGREEGKEES